MNASRISLAAPLTLAFAALACSGGTPQPPPAGTLKIVTKGGTATTGLGGLGGSITINGGGGGPLQLLQTGSFDPSFTVDATTPPALGSNPRTVSANATLVVNDPANPANGLGGDTDPTKPATGLWVKPGITLTLQPFAGTTSSLTVADGIFVEGTLTVTRTAAGDARNITFACSNLVATSASVIDLSGADATAAVGGFGGAFRVNGLGAIAHAGKFTAKGGNGTNGGSGGSFRATSETSAFASSGTIDVSGGSATAGVGGDAGFIRTDFASNYGDVGSSGGLTARGGDGTAAGGGGGTVTLLASSQGAVRSSSTINTSGGNATTGGNGGDAGPITLQSGGKDLLVTGSIQAQGGTGAGAAGFGGFGGFVTFARQGAVGGSVRLAAGIDTSGGSGTAGGGDGGNVTVRGDNGIVFTGSKQETSLLGYASIDTSGGGGTVGRNAGSVTVDQFGGWSEPGGSIFYSDDVRNEVPITAKGGAGSAGNGGRGGNVAIRNRSSLALPTTLSTVNVADIDASGGTGTAAGGNGATVTVSDYFRVSNQGKVNVSGGAGGTTQGGSGGGLAVGFYQLFSPLTATNGPAENLGEVKAGGGTATTGVGGSGGVLLVLGSKVTAVQNFTGDGAASTGSTGGFGGIVVLASLRDATLFSGTLSVKAGASAAGATPPLPTDGNVLIDGVAQPLTGGQYMK